MPITERAIGPVLAGVILAATALVPSCGREAPRVTRSSPSPTPAPKTSWETGEPALDALQARLLPLLDANRKAFIGRTGPVRGFGAGEAYPQIWLRDSATLLPLSRFHEERPALESWLLEHLAHQEESGALFDWIAPGEPASFPYAPRARVVYRSGPLVVTADKNTTAADQEASAVLAAGLVHAALRDPDWLRKDVTGRPLVQRLDSALAYVRRERVDARTGLVVTALTADWGDVSPAHADQSAIYLDDATPRVGSLYASALYHGAVRVLVRLLGVAGEPARAEHWEAEAAAMRRAVERELWSETDGFFRVHAELPATGPHPKDSLMFALGGNAMAVLHGLSDETRAARILAAAESRHERYGLTTLAGSLLPPYPTGFFKHPILKDEWAYQNGGLWDWFSGRFLLGLFELGQSEAATRHLLAIARRVERSDGLYEWTDREGRGRGSPLYAGSGAALAQATLEGLFGIRGEGEGASLRIRLGNRSGRARTEEPATGRAIAYEYRVDLARGELHVRLSAPPRLQTLEVLLPAGLDATAVRGGASPLAFTVRTVGRDRYVALEGPVMAGDITVTLGPAVARAAHTQTRGRPAASRAAR